MNLRMVLKKFYGIRIFKTFRNLVHDVRIIKQVSSEKKNKGEAVSADYNLCNNLKLFYWKLSESSENLGDYLAKVVVTHFMPKKQVSQSCNCRTLYGIGSLLGLRCQDAIIWGSGMLNPTKLRLKRIKHSDLDIRAVRGPKTREQLLMLGKDCPTIYGDPAILMPKVFTPGVKEKVHDISLVMHYAHDFVIPDGLNINLIDIVTKDYENFIEQIVQSSLIISSSLHGIILAETYGVPAILLLEEKAPTFKYEDWYNSTGRYNIVIAHSIQEALSLKPMDLPNLKQMQENLLDSFPYDLWN